MTFLAMEREERLRLRRLSRSTKAPHAVVQRARAMCALRRGSTPTEVAKLLGASDRWVHKWRTRWVACPSVESLEDADRSGRPPVISVATKCELVKLACDRPPKATFSDDEQARAIETRHSTAREAARIGHEAKVKRLVLTHLSSRHDVDPRPLLEQAKQEYAGPLEIAYDGFTLEVPLRD